ncbi:TonB-dependent receptor [Cellvibrio polysaccharolyticus]|uniref:TonB-dependent receptor n=1 Tax=Cellvibrio polysaccharolyticus TaxID=2082724 RepID=A0A928YWR9_9GAMM|nr:TonB-dependent receptor [Cellvibrio polysaccharolyticus]MBE8718513.1 TonB-dependent receptor [Cellvibrio polysaccharolyticus]
MPRLHTPASHLSARCVTRPFKLPFLPAALFLALFGNTALAQQPAASEAEPVETMIVIGRAAAMALDTAAPAANRLGLTHRETPATLDVLTQERMQIEGLRTSVEALNAAPGVNSGTLPGSVGVSSMRGFTSTAIAYLFDGVRVTGSNSAIRNFDTFNFERVEILKGPASVLYGEGALAGAINLVPKRAYLNEWSGAALISGGSFDTFRAGVGGNIPLNDIMALRTDVSMSQSDGWADDTDSKTTAITNSLLIKPSERLTINLFLDYFKDESTTPYFGSTLVPLSAARDPVNLVSNNQGLVVDRATIRTNYNVDDGLMDSESWQLRSRANYQLDSQWSLVGEVAGYTADRLWKNVEDVAFNSSTGLLNRSTTRIAHDHDYWSARGWAAFDGDIAGRRTRFTLGAEYSDTSFGTSRRFGTTTAVDRFHPQRGLFPALTEANFPGSGSRVEWQSDSTTEAVFMEAAHYLTQGWQLVGGLRYERVDLDRETLDLNTGALANYGQDYDPLSWRLGSVFDVTPRTHLYAQFSHAVTPVSSFLFLNSTNAQFDLSSGDAFELGVKTSFWNERADLTAAVYHITQDDILTRDPLNPAMTVQGGSQESYGVELSFSAAFTDQFRIDANTALLHTEFTKLLEAGGANREGNRPSNVPEQLFNISAYYSLLSLPVTFGTTVRHNGDFYTNNANTYRVDGHTLLDAQISWQTAYGLLTLRGRNLTDELYADWSGYGATQLYLGAPRSVDLTMSHKF